jgi:multidrug resistance efflux pump
MEKLPPIPTPVGQRWREFRIQVLPLIIFLCVLAAVMFLWRNFVAPSGIVGEVEAIKADVISLQDGRLVRLDVDRFEQVTAGQEIGVVEASSADFVKASIGAVETDLRVLDTRIDLDRHRNEQSYHEFERDMYTEQIQLAADQASLKRASNDFWRAQQSLNHTPPTISEEVYDLAKGTYETLQAAVETRTKAIENTKAALEKLRVLISAEEQNPVEDAIKAKIKEVEEELKPTILRAPMTGVISMIYHRANERVVRGAPILTITAQYSDRIVGYMRQPINVRPTTNDTVVVRTRTQKRQYATAKILRVGSQMELINPALISTDSNRVEVGLPILVELPSGMTLVPGEFVDLSIQYTKR